MGSVRMEFTIGGSGGTTTTTTTTGRRSRYTKSWESPQEDTKLATRVGRVVSQATNYKEIKETCLKQGALWEDPDFPAVDKSVFFSQSPPAPFKWMRPTEIVKDPRFIIGGATRFDVLQGDLGNCWFLSAVASLCASGNKFDKKLLERVVCPDNNFVKDYAGVFHFQIWQYGKWVDVLIDDRLPTLDGRLVMMHSKDSSEFWSALLEKAYAKLNGSYEALQGGQQSEAMEDFTGGLNELFNFSKEVPKDLCKILRKAYKRASMMGCTIDAQPGQLEAVLDNGLIMGHAYSVTAVREAHVQGNNVNLLRVRNPWGNQYEWKGAWSDKSPEMQAVSEDERKRLGITVEDDGEFWMSYDDFIRCFSKLEICHLGPCDLVDSETGSRSHKWEEQQLHGSWKRRVNAGGCRNFLDTFWTNPQYKVQVVDPDEDDDDNTGTIVVALLQKEGRKKRQEGADFLTIGYMIYQLPDPDSGPLDKEFFNYNRAVARSASFCNMREICGRHKLPSGHYCVIPCTYKPHEEGEFLVRIFSERPHKFHELDETTGVDKDENDEKYLDDLMKGMGNVPGVSVEVVHKVEPMKRKIKSKEVTEQDVSEERHARELFRKAAGDDMEVDCFELRTIVNEHFMKMFKFDGFSLQTCRSMVALLDNDKSGMLGYEEFKRLWSDLRRWTKVFKEYDAEKDGTFNSFELRQALNSAGYKVSNATFNSLVMRYSDRQGRIYFNDYIHCAVRLMCMFDTYKEWSANKDEASFKLDEFIQTTMYS